VALISLNEQSRPTASCASSPGLWVLFLGLVGALLYFKSHRNLAWSVALRARHRSRSRRRVERSVHTGALYLIWLYAAFPIGWAISHLLLATIYYECVDAGRAGDETVVVRSTLRRLDRTAGTYWQPAEAVRQKSDYHPAGPKV
jgi:uncharacterized iron-regulated membrane protein